MQANDNSEIRLQWLPFGECALRAVLAVQPSVATSQRLAALARALQTHPQVRDVAIGLLEIVCYLKPGSRFDDFIEHPWSASLPFSFGAGLSGDSPATRHHRIPVDYCGEDLPELSQRTGFSIDALIASHSQPVYTVAMIGFLPGFPYLLGLPESLSVPRRSEPRKKVRAGAVAIANGQAGIYPADTPGGWHILGYCDPACCVDLQAGDTLVFSNARELSP